MSVHGLSGPRQKATLRQQYRKVRASLDAPFREQAGREVLAQVLALPEYARAGVVHTYLASDDHEVATLPIVQQALAHGRRVVVPVVVPGTRRLRHALADGCDRWRPDRWGLPSPPSDHSAWVDDISTIGLVLVPGLAFDRLGRRLGYGGGYYDRFLAQIEAPKAGITYGALLVAELPEEAHDVRMDLIVTEAGVHRSPQP